MDDYSCLFIRLEYSTAMLAVSMGSRYRKCRTYIETRDTMSPSDENNYAPFLALGICSCPVGNVSKMTSEEESRT